MATTAELLNSIWSAAKKSPVSVSSVKQANKINDRYAREVLGLMVTKGILSQDDDTLDYIAITDVTGQQVADVINALTPPEENTMATTTADEKVTVAKKTTAKSTKTATNVTDCLCGCGAKVAGKSNYKPGHDARHAGQVAREIVANYTTKGYDRREDLAALPSDALKAKAESIAERMIEKIEVKAKPEPEPTNATPPAKKASPAKRTAKKAAAK